MIADERTQTGQQCWARIAGDKHTCATHPRRAHRRGETAAKPALSETVPHALWQRERDRAPWCDGSVGGGVRGWVRELLGECVCELLSEWVGELWGEWVSE